MEAAITRGLAQAASSSAATTRVVEALGMKMGWPVVELWLADEPREVLCCAARHVSDGRHLGDFASDELDPGTGLPVWSSPAPSSNVTVAASP